jgi:hypothetical protein
MKQRTLAVLFCTICVALGVSVHLLRRHLTMTVSAAASFKDFTIYKTEGGKSRNPNDYHREVVEAYRSDGSHVTAELVNLDPRTPSRRTVWLAPEQQRIRIEDRVRSKTTWVGIQHGSRRVTTDPQCGFARMMPETKARMVGESQLLGVRTVVVEAEHRLGDPSGQFYKTTTWTSPDLDCVTLKMTETRYEKDGTASGSFEMVVDKVVLGPPDPALFEVPTEYTELKPSQMFERLVGRSDSLGRPIPKHVSARLTREDRQYEENRRPQAHAK